MKDEITKCDICEKILQIGSEKIKKKNGVTWTLGYSKGGWGSRENCSQFTGEVCDECFDEFMKWSESFNKTMLFKRKGINKQTVSIS